MIAFRQTRQKQFSLLIAALLLLSNALVTAHAFGDVDHAVKEGCQILHQFERQQSSPVEPFAQSILVGEHLAPADECRSCAVAATKRHFQPRAPPIV